MAGACAVCVSFEARVVWLCSLVCCGRVVCSLLTFRSSCEVDVPHPVRSSTQCRSHACQAYFEFNCDDAVGIAINYLHADCRSSAIDYPFVVEIPDFRTALINAARHIGAAITL